MKIYLRIFYLLIALFCFRFHGAHSEEIKNVILIGWDGAQRNHLNEMISHNELPNFSALCREGKKVDIDVTDGATDTKAGWSQILSGCKAETTGVYNNNRYQPIPKGYTIFERLEKYFGADNIATIAVIGKSGHVDAGAPQKIPYEKWQKRNERQKTQNTKKPNKSNLQGGRIIEENGSKFVLIPGKPYYNAKEAIDLFVNGLIQNDVVGKRVLQEIEKNKERRFFMFVHFAEPDRAGHKFGENSKEYSDGIKSDDEWTGKIISKLKELNLYNNTLVYVTADHGFDEGKTSHRYAPYVFLGTNDLCIIRNGDRMDIAPTILKRFGIDLNKLEPKIDGKSLDIEAK
jgi:hypothetical protein